jgi:hypothetical protein
MDSPEESRSRSFVPNPNRTTCQSYRYQEEKIMRESKTVQTMNTSDRTIGEIVAEDYRTAKNFESHGIDFCCGGNVALAATCAKKKIDLATITGELEAVKSEPVKRSQNYASWEMPFLADYIRLRFHQFRLKLYHDIIDIWGSHNITKSIG